MVAARLAALVLALAALVAACWLTGCGSKQQAAEASSDPPSAAEQMAAPGPTITPASATAPLPQRPREPLDPIVLVRTSAGDIKLQLFAAKAPQTVDNFLNTYAGRGFYEQTIFHHVQPGAMIITGGYTADLEPKETRTPIYNESRGGLSNRRGTVAMIHDPQSPHSATSQFFINLADHPDLDARSTEEEDTFGFCVFGEVIEGLDVAERIASAPASSQGDFASLPSPAIVITAVERLR